jgi:hypothetical protein
VERRKRRNTPKPAANITVKAADEMELRAFVLIDENAGSVIGGRKLAGKSQDFRQRLPSSVLKSGEVRLRAIVTDDGGNQIRTLEHARVGASGGK